MNVFHFVIIAYLVVLSGCGYKADPFYSGNADCFGCESPRNDEVERILLLAKAKSSKNF